ncbi:hypothetical protein [Natrarchaeobaculum sulfurireducens]|nr:hypothetical protein [Natrarchaeobaculum sulfurireducens]
MAGQDGLASTLWVGRLATQSLVVDAIMVLQHAVTHAGALIT